MWIGYALAAAGGLILLYGGAIVLTQVLGWLELGIWDPAPVSELLIAWGYEGPTVEWRGVQKIIDWFLSWPAIIPIIVLGYGLVISGMSKAELHRLTLNPDSPV